MPRELVVSVLCQDDPYELFNNMIFNINLDYRQKQELLEENHILKRLDMLLRMLQHEIAVLDLERDIQERTKESMDRSQKEFYLREQMHIIEEQLGEAEDEQEDAAEYVAKIKELKLEPATEEKLLKEADRIGKTAAGNAGSIFDSELSGYGFEPAVESGNQDQSQLRKGKSHSGQRPLRHEKG